MIELQKASYRKDFSFEIDYGADRELQVHKNLELLYVLSGCVNVQVNGKSLSLKEDDLLVLNAYEVYQIHYQMNSHTLSLFLGQGILGEHYHSYQCCSKEAPDPDAFAVLKGFWRTCFGIIIKTANLTARRFSAGHIRCWRFCRCTLTIRGIRLLRLKKSGID